MFERDKRRIRPMTNLPEWKHRVIQHALDCTLFALSSGKSVNLQERKGWKDGGMSVHLGISAKHTRMHATSKQKTNQINHQFMHCNDNNNLVKGQIKSCIISSYGEMGWFRLRWELFLWWGRVIQCVLDCILFALISGKGVRLQERNGWKDGGMSFHLGIRVRNTTIHARSKQKTEN